MNLCVAGVLSGCAIDDCMFIRPKYLGEGQDVERTLAINDTGRIDRPPHPDASCHLSVHCSPPFLPLLTYIPVSFSDIPQRQAEKGR